MIYKVYWASQVSQWKRIHLPMQETEVWFTVWEDRLEEELATHCSILAWIIQEEPRAQRRLGATAHGVAESDMTEHTKCLCMYVWTLLFWSILICGAVAKEICISSFQFSSVVQSWPTLCDLMDHSTPGLLDHHQFPEFLQTHVHRVDDAIQPSHPLSSPSPPALNPSQHQGLFKWFSSSHLVKHQSIGVYASTSVLPMNT